MLDILRSATRSAWGEPRPPNAPVRVWRDWALVGVLLPATVLEAALRPDMPARVDSALLTVVVIATLLLRRTRPLLMVGIAFGACAVGTLLDGHSMMYAAVAVLLLPYALFRWGSGQEAAIGLPIILTHVGTAMAVGESTLGDVLGGVTITCLACTMGAAVRYRTGARARELDQIKLLERERLARDLHDTVAHHVSAIVIRAQAGLVTAPSEPGAATDALRVIENEATTTLTEMRSMVRVLRRNEPIELAPNPRIADLERLAANWRPGPPVDVQLRGDFDDVPPSVGAAIYRLVQESVTNARRHARQATRIEVQVAADDTAVRLRVSDDGTSPAGRPTPAPGFGLVGMIERAQLLGGSCQAGPGPDRGWQVTAVLPRAGWVTA